MMEGEEMLMLNCQAANLEKSWMFCGKVTFLTCAIGSQVKVFSQVEGCLLKEKVLLSEDLRLLVTEQKETITNIILTAPKEILVDQVKFKKQWKFCHQKGVNHPFGSGRGRKKKKKVREQRRLFKHGHTQFVGHMFGVNDFVSGSVVREQTATSHLRSQLSSGDSLRCYPSEIRMQAV